MKSLIHKPYWVQGIVIVLCLLFMTAYFQSIPLYYETMRTECVFHACQYAPAPPVTSEELKALHLTSDTYALLFVIMDTLLTVFFYAAAAIVLWKCSREWMGLLGVLMLVSFGTVFPSVLALTDPAGSFRYIFVVGWSSFILFFLLFPNGRFMPKWTSIAAYLYLSVQGIGLLIPAFQMNHWPIWVKSVTLFVPIAVMAYSQLYRFRHADSPTQRQQTKWVVYGFALTLAGFVAVNLIYSPEVMHSASSFLYMNAILNVFMAIVPTTLTLSILRHRLWDIDPLVNRTLVYAALSACIIAIYILSVTYLGGIFHTEDNLFISLSATAVVAVLFAPLKELLQRAVNRMLYGKKDEPFSVLAELSRQWEQPMAPEAAADVIVRTIRESLRLPYAAISFTLNGRETVVASAGTGSSDIDPISLPIVHRGEDLGFLLVSPRSPGEPLTAEDRRLLDVLIRQAGPIIQGIKMSVGLQLLAADAQESRERLVLAREEERRRLRRNLHDDLAPKLAALALNAAAAERYVRKDPDTATVMLSELRKVIRSTVDEIRALVHDLRPLALDELGLLGAVRERIDELAKTRHQLSEAMAGPAFRIDIETDEELPPLPAAVEVAAFRIVTESVVNVIRHSRASLCTVKIGVLADSQLRIEISDNGIGFAERKAASRNGGIGMKSMREQAAELGGHCLFEQRAEGGMRVSAILPFVVTEEERPDEYIVG
ncbi:sensor histidine kinase [Cohnella suwonensis]|uniref:histidine kinase n=1 Tax=Cohnella suwonensis TaxID=696072 RepID=A0ABW0LXC1_9BACL